MVATPELIRIFERVAVTWSASILSIAAADAILDNQKELEENRAITRKSIDFFCASMETIPGVKPFRSYGNYVLVDASDTGRTALEIVEEMYEAGFIIKALPELHGRTGIFRITPGTERQNMALAEALRNYLNP